MSVVPLRWHVHADGACAAAAVVARLAACAAGAIAARGRFDVVLAGGSTPRRAYAAARSLTTDWHAWHVWFTDERCLLPGHAERNDAMVRAAWLDHVPLPSDQVHAIPAERGAEGGARAYCSLLAGLGAFDFVLLGLGEDGHTASLFPGDPIGDAPDAPDALAVHGAPKPPPERVSLSAARLSHANAVLVLALGADKRDALARWRRGDDLPIAAVAPDCGIDIHTDAAAAPGG